MAYTISPPSDLQVAQKMINIFDNAKKREIPFDLSFKEVKRLLTRKTCYFTGVPMNTIPSHKYQRTFDRVDSFKGYVDGNVVACTQKINGAKDNLSKEEIEALYVGLKNKGMYD